MDARISRRRWLAALALVPIAAACAPTASVPAAPPVSGAAPATSPQPTSTSAPASPPATATVAPGVAAPTSRAAPVVVSSPLLEAPLKDLRSGQNFTLGEMVRGQVVVLKPMAVW